MKKLLNVLFLIVVMLVPGMAESEKSPSKIELNVIERFRFTGWDNAVGLDDGANDAVAFTRHRTSLALRWQFNPDLVLVDRTSTTREKRSQSLSTGRDGVRSRVRRHHDQQAQVLAAVV